MSKELFMSAHEELIEEEMERTGCDWTTAYELMADRAWDRMTDRLADMADHYHQMQKDAR
jgi:hypothetical protein